MDANDGPNGQNSSFTDHQMEVIVGAIHNALDTPTGLTALQRKLLIPLVETVTHTKWHAQRIEPHSPEEMAEALREESQTCKIRITQVATTLELILSEIPQTCANNVCHIADALGVREGMADVAYRVAQGDVRAAVTDFEREAIEAQWQPEKAKTFLHTTDPPKETWGAVCDVDLAHNWHKLKDMPDGSLGRKVYEFYTARGFKFPGEEGSVSPFLGQHDFCHVLFDYGTKVESELEVFAAIAFSNPDPKAFSYLVAVLGVFQGGYFQKADGSFTASPGHLNEFGMATRFVDAVRRGIDCIPDDLMDEDWFEVAHLQVDEVRKMKGIPTKSELAVQIGSVGPFEVGGISEFQDKYARAEAAKAGRPYDSFGTAVLATTATPLGPEIATIVPPDHGQGGLDGMRLAG